MKTLALWAIALALLISAGVGVYETPEVVCARHRDRALALYEREPMIRSRYRVHLTETIQQKKGMKEFAREVRTSREALDNFDEAYDKYLALFETLHSAARSTIERKYTDCRGDWTANQ